MLKFIKAWFYFSIKGPAMVVAAAAVAKQCSGSGTTDVAVPGSAGEGPVKCCGMAALIRGFF